MAPFPEPRNTGMLYRRLGRSGLYVSALGLGGWLTYGGYATDDATFACMKKAYDLGINLFDTAENYTGGEAEKVMGRAIKHFGWKRSDLVISTKINYGAVNGEILINNHGQSRKHIIEGLEASLERLQLKAYNYVIEKGMALYWGTSEWGADEIQEAVGIARDLRMMAPVVEQPCYNLLTRDKVEGQFQRLYERSGLGLTTYSPLQMGILSGKYDDTLGGGGPPAGSRLHSSRDSFADSVRARIGSEAWRAQMDKVRRLGPVAERLGCTRSQMALAWCLLNANVSSVITGASRPEQLEENARALQFVDRFTPEILKEIDEIMGNAVTLDADRQS